MLRVPTAVAVENTGVGNGIPAPLIFTTFTKGGDWSAMPSELLYGPSVSWYSPPPPRIAVRPSPPTSHAKPTRGATFFSDGLTNGPPSTVSGDVRTSGRYASRPFLSFGTVKNSYRTPRFSVTFDVTR